MAKKLSNTQIKKMKRQYVRAGIVSLDEVMPLIRDPAITSVELHGHKVNVTSLRLQNFAKSHVCVTCGLVATHFAVESNSSWHLNLYADRGPEKREMMFTHDHTLARSLGGTDDESNTTTMCAKCNQTKSVGEFAEYCRRNNLTMPGEGKSKAAREKRDEIILEVGQTIRKVSRLKFRHGGETAVIQAICTNLFDPQKRLAYVLPDQSFVNVNLCVAVA